MKLRVRVWLAMLAGIGMGAPAIGQPTSDPDFNWTVREVSGEQAVAWSIRTLGNGTSVVQVASRWRTERAASGAAGAHHGSQTNWQPDCANSNVLRIADRFYDIDGKQTQHLAGAPEWIRFSDTGLNEPVFRAVCSGSALPPAGKISASMEGTQLWLAGLLKN